MFNMKILKVIHGFPPDYMAGSEVYSFNLVKELKKHVDIYVFTTIENSFFPAYTVHNEAFNGIKIRRINKSRRDYSYEDKFFDRHMDSLFRQYLKEIKPDVVHIGHLSHLSTRLLNIIKEHHIPIVFTVHDFWLFCVKGQLLNEKNEICKGPDNARCDQCTPYDTTEKKVQSIATYMQKSIRHVDKFLIPSNTVREFFLVQGVPKEKLIYSKYGFDKDKITNKRKSFTSNSKLNFGFMGRVIPSKGIKVLIDAFEPIDVQLSIYGDIGNQKRFLEHKHITFKGGYDNNNINHVLSEIDVLVVPSIWLENSPLVIQEAFLAGVPVITSNLGGMKELVTDGVNGFLFEANNAKSLRNCVLKIHHDPTLLNDFLISRDDVRSIKDDALFTLNIYKELISNAT